MRWFTGDFHLGHESELGGVIKYCNRPFANVVEMNETIINNCNSLVQKQDELYFLGDFAFSKDRKKWLKIYRHFREQINCRHIILIAGNHDPHYKDGSPKKELLQFFEKIYTTMIVREQGHKIYLNHYANRVWPNSHYGSYHCSAHSHGTLPDDIDSLSMDVGIDAIAKRLSIESNHNVIAQDYRPISFDEIKGWMCEKNWKSPLKKR
ncbi:MAG TPA: metallophosphoesterase [Alphaproteobacteria bacterium]|nr:metallophosphoesterase [Alphaproteobacteria bacterium]